MRASAGLLPRFARRTDDTQVALERARFGRTGLEVSRICLGTMTFGLQCDEATARAILDRAYESGIDFLDTADSYPLGSTLETVGVTEEILGRWLKGRRHDLVIATKFGRPTGPKPWDSGGSRKHILAAIDASLRRLQTDYVDIYQMHFPDPRTPIDETLEALDSIVRAGKARYIGCSNLLAYQVVRAIGRSELRGMVAFGSVQPRYNLLFREVERELIPMCAELGLAVVSYNPLAGGVLTGKHQRSRRPNMGRFSGSLPSQAGPDYFYWHDRAFETVEALRPIAADLGISLTTTAVAWVLANPIVTCPIIGASRPEHLADALAALRRPLDAAAKAALDAATREYRYGDALI